LLCCCIVVCLLFTNKLTIARQQAEAAERERREKAEKAARERQARLEQVHTTSMRIVCDDVIKQIAVVVGAT
jgi:DsbC/DsbD-like thiol-disulfide interchange protein